MTRQIPSSSPENLTGLIERVTFHNTETGFAVLRVKAKGDRECCTVVGSLPAVAAGEWLVAEGTWIQDREHGRQFQAGQLRCLPPASLEGIEKYLGSGLIKGLGPIYAQKMVARFGEKVFEIIDQYSARLEEIEGIGPARRRQIKAAWTEQKAVRNIMVFLHTHGIGTSRALRIYRTYGDTAIERIRANPYALAEDIQGIGFWSADRIAQRLGISFCSPMRIGAGLTHLLFAATRAGHCALPRPLLIEKAVALLAPDYPGEGKSSPLSAPEPPLAPDSGRSGGQPGSPSSDPVNESQVTETLAQMLANKDVILETSAGKELVFHPALHAAEVGIAAAIHRLSTSPSMYPTIDLPKAVAWCQKNTGVQLAPSQQNALAMILAHRLVIITGGPGVGKTTLLNSLLRILTAKNLSCLLAAPTGRAAKRLKEATGLEAKTIHRLLEFQPSLRGFGRNEARPLEGDVLVVDEMSMVDVPLMHKLLKALSPHSSLVLVGDADQLPSVGPGTVLRDLIHSGLVPVVRLTEIFRQSAGSQIITTAHRVNRGEMPEFNSPVPGADFFFIERTDPERICQTVLDLVRERIPRKFGLAPGRDIQVLTPMNRSLLGTRELNRRLQETLNPPSPDGPAVDRFGWQYRVGDKVIQVENNYEKEVFNGDIGVVRLINLVEQTVIVAYEDRDVEYDFGELDELSLAYAITIHKAQGSEFPAVVIPLSMQHYVLLQRNLIYTGITRGRKLVVVVGQRKALQRAIHHGVSEERISGLSARLITRVP